MAWQKCGPPSAARGRIGNRLCSWKEARVEGDQLVEPLIYACLLWFSAMTRLEAAAVMIKEHSYERKTERKKER